MASGPISSWQIDGEKVETMADFIFLDSKITVDGDCSHEVKRCLLHGRKAMTNLDTHFKKQRHNFADHSWSYGFSSSHVWMWELDPKEGWVLKNGCFWIVVLEETFESPLDSKELKLVNPKGNQPWIFIWRTNVEAPILWPPDPKIWLSGKDLNAGKERGQEEERMRWLDGITNSMNMNLSKPGRQWRTGSLACCSSWSRRVGHNLATE